MLGLNLIKNFSGLFNKRQFGLFALKGLTYLSGIEALKRKVLFQLIIAAGDIFEHMHAVFLIQYKYDLPITFSWLFFSPDFSL